MLRAQVADDGSSVWRYETISAERQAQLDPREARIFWWSLYLFPVLWAAMGLALAVTLNLEYLLVVALALVMSGANVVGYVRASREQSRQVGTVLSGLRMAVGGAKSLI